MKIAVLLCVGAALAAAALAGGATGPTLLTYSLDYGGRGSTGLGGGICVARVDGSRRLRLTAERDDRAPSWSPAGRYVAFVRQVPGAKPLQVLIADARGRIVGRVRRPAVFNQDPAWSPDGRRIAFVGSWRGAALSHVDRNGGNLRTVFDAYAISSPTWSPDSRQLAFAQAAYLESPSIWIVNADGTGARRLVRDANDPAWSRHGMIAFVHAGDIYVADADGSHRERAVTATPETESAPAWSRDGSMLAFERAGVGIVVHRIRTGAERVAIADPRAREPAWRPPAPLPRARRAPCR